MPTSIEATQHTASHEADQQYIEREQPQRATPSTGSASRGCTWRAPTAWRTGHNLILRIEIVPVPPLSRPLVLCHSLHAAPSACSISASPAHCMLSMGRLAAGEDDTSYCEVPAYPSPSSPLAQNAAARHTHLAATMLSYIGRSVPSLIGEAREMPLSPRRRIWTSSPR